MASGLAALRDYGVDARSGDRFRVINGGHHRDNFDSPLAATLDHLRRRIAQADTPYGHALFEDDFKRRVDKIGNRARTRCALRDSQPLAKTIELSLDFGHKLIGDS